MNCLRGFWWWWRCVSGSLGGFRLALLLQKRWPKKACNLIDLHVFGTPILVEPVEVDVRPPQRDNGRRHHVAALVVVVVFGLLLRCSGLCGSPLARALLGYELDVDDVRVQKVVTEVWKNSKKHSANRQKQTFWRYFGAIWILLILVCYD